MTYNRNSAAAQRERLLKSLRRGPVDTVHAYRTLDILHVPRRVLELRRAGYDIKTEWVERVTEQGVTHRVGRYRLIDSPEVAA
ncbi:helix-turn-helix domain-containing protein [Robbsia andropogonis]|uniref:helix-turn-helix domain-containing protein n=1 Tax=Robbsia andropogonis TaxID=28092 RepID=UPI000467C95F|nr:helix-turn-helix domain-containing protein [Robbsia andropogonis]